MFTPKSLRQNSVPQNVYNVCTRMLTPELPTTECLHRSAYTRTPYTRMFTPECLHQHSPHQNAYTRVMCVHQTPYTQTPYPIAFKPESLHRNTHTRSPYIRPRLFRLESLHQNDYTTLLTASVRAPPYDAYNKTPTPEKLRSSMLSRRHVHQHGYTTLLSFPNDLIPAAPAYLGYIPCLLFRFILAGAPPTCIASSTCPVKLDAGFRALCERRLRQDISTPWTFRMPSRNPAHIAQHRKSTRSTLPCSEILLERCSRL